METPRLPPELERLERELAERPRPAPSADLRDRVMRHVRAELEWAEVERAEVGHSELLKPELARRQRSGWLAFAVGTAAAVLVWLNLSLTAAHATSYDLERPAQSRSLDATARQIRQLLPEMSEREARRQAVILQGGADLVSCPNVLPGPRTPNRLNGLGVPFRQGE